MDKDLIGPKASSDMRSVAKNYGKNKVVGVIREGKYINPETGKPIKITKKKIVADKIYINWIGGKE